MRGDSWRRCVICWAKFVADWIKEGMGKLTKRHRVVMYVGATVAAITLTSVMLLTSESYEIARDFVENDPRVAQLTGAQKLSRIAPLKGFRSTIGSRAGEAHFTFKVNGERGSFDVRVAVEKHDGRWTVTEAQATSVEGTTKKLAGNVGGS